MADKYRSPAPSLLNRATQSYHQPKSPAVPGYERALPNARLATLTTHNLKRPLQVCFYLSRSSLAPITKTILHSVTRQAAPAPRPRLAAAAAGLLDALTECDPG